MPAGITYILGRALYVALTNRCNALPLAVTRGPSFVMPADSGFAKLPDGYEPSADDVLSAVQSHLGSEPQVGAPSNVVFAGLGEPLLRLGVLLEAAGRIEDAYPGRVCLRVSTNGLVPCDRAKEVARSLWDAGVRRATVTIASADEAQHRVLLAPRGAAIATPGGAGSGAGSPGLPEACHFVQALVAAGMEVDCTAVAEPSVDLAAAGVLADSLGASFRSRSYHP
jgi:hypothetical protein